MYTSQGSGKFCAPESWNPEYYIHSILFIPGSPSVRPQAPTQHYRLLCTYGEFQNKIINKFTTAYIICFSIDQRNCRALIRNTHYA